MNKNNQFLKDLQGYLYAVHTSKALTTEEKYNRILATFGHDLNGVIEDEPFFLPRVSGYAERLAH